MTKMKIQSGCWEDGTLTLSGMPENFILSARPVAVIELSELQDIVTTLDWMIAHFDFTNSQTGLHTEDSPELKKAKELYAELVK